MTIYQRLITLCERPYDTELFDLIFNRFYQLDTERGHGDDKASPYAFTQTIELIELFARTKYPRGLSITQAIVAGII